MQLESAIILRESDLTVCGKKNFEENGELCLESFDRGVRYACLRSSLVLFIKDDFTTYIVKNRYGETGIVKTGE